MHRRKFIHVTACGFAIVAGCTGSAGPDVLLEYSYEEGENNDEIPREIRDAADENDLIRGDEYKWVVVTIELLEGELDKEELEGHSYIETSVDSHFNRAVAITSPEDVQGTIPEGGEAMALYQIPADEQEYEWTIEQSSLEIEVTEQ